MFNKNEFAKILKKINELYENQTYFSQASGTNRTYLSQYMNMKLNNPPSPKVLNGIANASKGLYSYMNLMQVCGYINYNENDIKEELEKELKYYNLTEQEYTDAINCFMHDSKKIQSLLFALKFSPTIQNETIKKEQQVLLTIINYVLAFIPNDLEITNNKDTFYDEFTKALEPAKKVLLSLDKRKIIHNYKSNDTLSSKYYMCPVYGQILAGQPNWAEENIESYLPIDPELMGIVNPEEYYFLRVRGESMNKIIKNGAFALIHKQDYVENGEIAVVLVNGDNATLKKFSKQEDIIVLTPESIDETFEQQIYTKETPIKVIGKYVGKMEFNN